MKALGKVKCIWSPAFAYAIGLLATDGNLSSSGRHVNFTSKDLELVNLFQKSLKINCHIGRKSRGGDSEKKYYFLQIGDVLFYKFLLSVGLTPRKSKTIGTLKIPDQYFYDFLRGCIDGDGCIHTYKHPESQHLQLRVRLVSASKKFLIWIRKMTSRNSILGHFTKGVGVDILSFAMSDSTKLFRLIYYPGFPSSLKRKYNRANTFMRAWRNWNTRRP